MYDAIRRELFGSLSPRLQIHSDAVAAEAARLAPAFDADSGAATLAGLLHDCAKEVPAPEAVALAEAAGLALFDVERASPAVLHQRLGAHWARARFGVTDDDICRAIESHTTGRARMDGLARCLFVADWIAADRDYPGLGALREATARSADEGFLALLRRKRDLARQAGHLDHPWAVATLERWLG